MRFIREPECQQITGIGKTTRWRLEKEGKFPQRRQISENIIAWLSTDIEEWMQSRINDPVKAEAVKKKLMPNL